MSNQSLKGHITKCENYLSQGDIFKIDLVAPMADTEKLIYRTVDGQHINNILPDGTNGRIFIYEELLSLIETFSSEQRFFPFQQTERVIVSANLLRYFIVLSQTCDISGVDHPAKPNCAIAPILTIAQHCQNKVSIKYKDPKTNQENSLTVNIPDYMNEKIDSSFKDKSSDDFAFPNYLRENLDNWSKKLKNESPEHKLINGLKNSLNMIIENKKLEIYYLAQDQENGVPESYIDFCRVYTIQTVLIEKLKDKRIATLKSPYREQFARKFAEYYARIATPYPMRGELL
jgi:hypothetical protein